MSNFSYKNREFGVEVQTEGKKLTRVIIKDGTLDFPFITPALAADFLVSEYGGSIEEAVTALNDTKVFDGLEITGAVSKVEPTVKKGKGSKSPKAPKEPKEAKEKTPKAPKEPKEKPVKSVTTSVTFKLKDGDVTKNVAVKTILPDQVAQEIEDIKLTDSIGIHITRYSEKNRTTELYKFKDGVTVSTEPSANCENQFLTDKITNYADVKGDVLISGVSLMDAIFKFAEETGMSFGQADKYIKIKRGLIQNPEKKEEKKPVTEEELKGKKEAKKEAKKESKKQMEDKTPDVTAE